jgi:hypothetical protein
MQFRKAKDTRLLLGFFGNWFYHVPVPACANTASLNVNPFLGLFNEGRRG